MTRMPHLRNYDSQCYERQGRLDPAKAFLNLVPWVLPWPPPDPEGGDAEEQSWKGRECLPQSGYFRR